ncbi:MAG: hypothetical protein HQK66_12590 [Desulfamplus sp.]|nr:hypothetical protein [Desulfamplus sp.]
MEFVVQIQDQYKALKLVEFLRALDFVKIIQTNTTDEKIVQPETPVENTGDFFSYAGLWANREITVDKLRQQAWRQYSI